MLTIGRWGLRVPEGTDGPPNVPFWMNRLATDLTDVAKDNQGTLAGRPTSTVLSPGVPGRYYYVTGDATAANNNRLWRDTGTSWVELATGPGQARDVGEYKYAVDTASHGLRTDGLPAWLLCDGSETPVDYARLIAKLTGNPFGVGGAGRPRLPSLAGRVPLGAGAGSGLTARALGALVGEEAHVLIPSEGPIRSHTHSGVAASIGIVQGNLTQTFYNAGSLVASTGDVNGGQQNGAAHNNMQPSVAAGAWFIYAGPAG